MDLKTISINKILLLENYNFRDSMNNIDHINELCIHEKSSSNQLSLLNLAIHKLEKFHSFFHFEQSYFHLQLAIFHRESGDLESFRTQLDEAIFQDHNNIQAKGLLAHENSTNIYARPYNNFPDYVAFASEEEKIHIEPSSYWLMTAPSQIVKTLRENHLAYHKEAAKLYINRSIIFAALKKDDLSKNDLVKAQNLDGNLAEVARANIFNFDIKF